MLDKVELDGDERYAIDGTGPVVYRLEPSWMTAILCLRCEFVTVRPGLPRLLRQTVACSTCGNPIALEPPAEVLGARLPIGRPA